MYIFQTNIKDFLPLQSYYLLLLYVIYGSKGKVFLVQTTTQFRVWKMI